MRDRDCVTACRRSRPLRRRGEARLRARTPLRMKMPVTVWRRQSQCRKRYLQWRARYTCTAHFFSPYPRVCTCACLRGSRASSKARPYGTCGDSFRVPEASLVAHKVRTRALACLHVRLPRLLFLKEPGVNAYTPCLFLYFRVWLR